MFCGFSNICGSSNFCVAFRVCLVGAGAAVGISVAFRDERAAGDGLRREWFQLVGIEMCHVCVLQCVAVCCSVLQCVDAVCWY